MARFLGRANRTFYQVCAFRGLLPGDGEHFGLIAPLPAGTTVPATSTSPVIGRGWRNGSPLGSLGRCLGALPNPMVETATVETPSVVATTRRGGFQLRRLGLLLLLEAGVRIGPCPVLLTLIGPSPRRSCPLAGVLLPPQGLRANGIRKITTHRHLAGSIHQTIVPFHQWKAVADLLPQAPEETLAAQLLILPDLGVESGSGRESSLVLIHGPWTNESKSSLLWTWYVSGKKRWLKAAMKSDHVVVLSVLGLRG